MSHRKKPTVFKSLNAEIDTWKAINNMISLSQIYDQIFEVNKDDLMYTEHYELAVDIGKEFETLLKKSASFLKRNEIYSVQKIAGDLSYQLVKIFKNENIGDLSKDKTNFKIFLIKNVRAILTPYNLLLLEPFEDSEITNAFSYQKLKLNKTSLQGDDATKAYCDKSAGLLMGCSFKGVEHFRKKFEKQDPKQLNTSTTVPIPFHNAMLASNKSDDLGNSILEIESLAIVLRNIMGLKSPQIYKVLLRQYPNSNRRALLRISEQPWGFPLINPDNY